MNPAAEGLLGISRRRAAGAGLGSLVVDGGALTDLAQRVLGSAQSYSREVEIRANIVGAEERMVDCRASLLPDAGSGQAVLLEMTDFTQRTRISRENALILQHGAGRQMIRQLAHEIKNPLGGLRGAAQLLARELGSEELEEYTSVIISEADRLAGLVDTLLGPGGPPNKQPRNIHELLDHVARLVEAESGPRVVISRSYDPGLPLLSVDRDQLVQALLNLTQNACAAMPDGGRLTLRTRAASNFMIGDTRYRAVASIEIEDEGVGIPEGLKASVFYPLVTNRVDGTGLGLPVAQELVSRHGGLIEFESRPGKTVFFVRLPISEAIDG
jgi:two-component system nitrogen regulation sensor histidine kinase GlnL